MLKGKLREAIRQKEVGVKKLRITRTADVLDRLFLFDPPDDICNYRAIIDVGAGFRDFSPTELAYLIHSRCGQQLNGVTY
jgi:hypothetical protein